MTFQGKALHTSTSRARRVAIIAFALSLVAVHLTPATAATASTSAQLVTCIDLQSVKERIAKNGSCRITQEATAKWHLVQSDSPITSGSSSKTLTVCSNKEGSLVSFQIIRSKCARHFVSSLYSRSIALASKPVIAQAVSYGYDSSQIALAQDPVTNPDAPIAYYTVTSSKGNTQRIYSWRDLNLVISGLQALTTYTFTVTATTADGTSPVSAASIPVTTPAYVPPVPVVTTVPLAAPAFTLSSVAETRTVNTAATGFTVASNSGGTIASFAISPAAPAGMTFNTSTGALSGTPTSVDGATAYTITATNATGNATATFTLTVTAVPIVISVAAIAGVTAPVTGATPVSTTTAGTGYTGTVTWSGSPLTFASVTTYTATITLTATSGYTLTGVSANFFTVAGATAVTNLANAGVITAAFPATVVVPAAVAITRASVGTGRRTAFTTQPQITIQDSGGNTVTSSSAVVTATVSAGGTLVGTTTATASSGVATFTDLGVDGTIGATYTITYTVSGLTIATATVTLSGTTCDGSFTCQVGDTGPGGGKIFYVASTFFTQVGATGSMCTTTCKYLEAAPNTWSGGSPDPAITWSTGSNQTSAVTGADETVIGTGYQNSLDIVAQTGNLAASSAAVVARAYTGGSKNDWFLPSKNELAQLYAQKTRVGGFRESNYWSSSESSAVFAWVQWFAYGNQGFTDKYGTFYVRPVRAF